MSASQAYERPALRKSLFLTQYEKFSTFLRNELCSNNLRDFGLKKGLDQLDGVRQTHLQQCDLPSD